MPTPRSAVDPIIIGGRGVSIQRNNSGASRATGVPRNVVRQCIARLENRSKLLFIAVGNFVSGAPKTLSKHVHDNRARILFFFFFNTNFFILLNSENSLFYINFQNFLLQKLYSFRPGQSEGSRSRQLFTKLHFSSICA